MCLVNCYHIFTCHKLILCLGEFLKQCKPFVEEGVHPRVIIRSFRKATALALEKIRELSVGVAKENKEELRSLLVKCAATAMSSKLIHQQKDFFSNMVRSIKLYKNLNFRRYDIHQVANDLVYKQQSFFRLLTQFKLLMTYYHSTC